MRTATLQDVAELAGVSAKTVSRVINDESSVRGDTRERVLLAAQRLNYRPNLFARGLTGRHSYTVGLVYDSPNAYYVISGQVGALKACDELGYGLQIHPFDSTMPELDSRLRDFVHRSRLAGLVLAQTLSEQPSLLRSLAADNIPFVPIVSSASKPDQSTPSVHINDRHAVYTVVAHLIQLGHLRIGFLRGGERHHASAERFAGYKAALKDYGIAVHEQLVIDGDYLFEDGFRGARRLLQLDQPPTAIFGCNDEIAAGALAAARSVGLHIPHDISIAGFEDSVFSRHSWPPLTTAKQPAEIIVEHATRMLIALVSGKQPASELFIPELIVRSSTAPPPAYLAG